MHFSLLAWTAVQRMPNHPRLAVSIESDKSHHTVCGDAKPIISTDAWAAGAISHVGHLRQLDFAQPAPTVPIHDPDSVASFSPPRAAFPGM
jgi:hypothetical protein